MKILLDSHILLWALAKAERLSGATRAAIESGDVLVYVSLVSLWELRIKESIGKIRLPQNFYTSIEPAGFQLLPLQARHIHEYGLLPLHHRDPFDRMLIAQARSEQLMLATDDTFLSKYPVQILA